MAAAAEYVQSNKKHLEDMRRTAAPRVFILGAERDVAVAESLYRSVVAVQGMILPSIAEVNTSENQLWNWFDQLTESVVTGLVEGRIADIAIVSASGTLIFLGVAGGPATIMLAAAASSILLAGDLVARLRKSKTADTQEERLAAATLLIEKVTTIAGEWLKTLKCRSVIRTSA